MVTTKKRRKKKDNSTSQSTRPHSARIAVLGAQKDLLNSFQSGSSSASTTMGKNSEQNQSNLSNSKSVGKNDAQVKKVVCDAADERLVDLSKYTESKINNMAKTELVQIVLSLGKISKRALDEMTNKQIREYLLALRKRQIEMKEKAEDKFSYPNTQQSTQQRNPPHKSSRYDGIAYRDLTAGDYYYDNPHPSPVYDYLWKPAAGRILNSADLDWKCLSA